jgi:hypothetical protein
VPEANRLENVAVPFAEIDKGSAPFSSMVRPWPARPPTVTPMEYWEAQLTATLLTLPLLMTPEPLVMVQICGGGPTGCVSTVTL